MDNIRLNFDGDINKLKEQINNVPYEQREAIEYLFPQLVS